MAQTTSTTNRPETISYNVPANATGNYTLEAVAVTDDADYSLSFNYPVEKVHLFTYDAVGLPVGEDTNLVNATFTVDGLGRVVRRTERNWKGALNSDTKYGFDDTEDSRVSETNAQTGTLSASYVTDTEGALSVRRSSTTTWQYYDGHGDLAQTADASGNAGGSFAMIYDEFGQKTGGSPTPYGWTGRQQRDTSALTGTIRMGVRLYDPALGRFLSKDPVDGGSLNDYEYAGQDPVNNYDLDGEIFWLFSVAARFIVKPLVKVAVKAAVFVAKKAVSAVRIVKSIRITRPRPHKPHHNFKRGLLRGHRKHIQSTVYRKGVDNSQRNIRIPYGRRR